MAQAEFREILSVPVERLFSTITDYEDYPEFVDGCVGVEILNREENGVTRVSYHVNLMSKDVIYTLEHHEKSETGQDSETRLVQWRLIESNFFKKNSGQWILRPFGEGKTEVTYSIEVEFKIPVPGFILNSLVKGSLPGMVRSFGLRASRSSSS